MYPLSQSKNPKASEEFLKAMEYRIYIKELHPFFDYDSFVMAPLLMKLNYHFKRGKALLPKESVEDIVWWTLFYKEIYGLLVPPRNDNSLAYENLPPEKFRKVHDMVYEMIMRYPEGKVYFDIPEIKAFRFKAMAILVGFYYKRYTRRYDGKSMTDKAIQENKDKVAQQNLQNIKNKYQIAYEKLIINSKSKDFMKREYFADMLYLITDSIVKYTFIYNTQKIPRQICASNDTMFLVDNTNKLFKFISNNNSSQAISIWKQLFYYKTDSYKIYKLLDYRCPNLRPEITQIVQKVEQLNRKLNKKDK